VPECYKDDVESHGKTVNVDGGPDMRAAKRRRQFGMLQNRAISVVGDNNQQYLKTRVSGELHIFGG